MGDTDRRMDFDGYVPKTLARMQKKIGTWPVKRSPTMTMRDLINTEDDAYKAIDSDESISDPRPETDEDRLQAIISEYLGDEFFALRFVECMEIMRRKNADYSQGEQKQDRIAAFKRIARDIDVPVRKAWAVFAQKHWGAIMRYVKDGFVESESIHGRINDMINYLVLFGAIVDWEEMGGEVG